MSRKRDLRIQRRIRRSKPKNWCQIYVLRENAGASIRYVGQTRCSAPERLRWHFKDLARCRTSGRPLSNFKKWLASLSAPPVIEVIEPNGIWNISEAVWIDRLRRHEPLLNTASIIP